MGHSPVRALGSVAISLGLAFRTVQSEPIRDSQSSLVLPELRTDTPALPTLCLSSSVVFEEHPSPPPGLGALISSRLGWTLSSLLAFISPLALNGDLRYWRGTGFPLAEERRSEILPLLRLSCLWCGLSD